MVTVLLQILNFRQLLDVDHILWTIGQSFQRDQIGDRSDSNRHRPQYDFVCRAISRGVYCLLEQVAAGLMQIAYLNDCDARREYMRLHGEDSFLF